VALPPLVEPADELTIDEVRRYSRHLIIPDVGMVGQRGSRMHASWSSAPVASAAQRCCISPPRALGR
jgi:hypothetical protein